ncbi:hypothetical protein F383_17219 [Gossypium arboreum]|uniref:Uncharacterized protein n=1 Tax=Gossypium arboreum TaxID=29729 RepID=A0A0B0MKG6_GOSAR|nr:hypothetical protein F383_38423 [Gossypium arboreum]KHG15481.1 hypothetical protein F383_17219 [Gossypium arboreum]
MSKLKTIC